MLKQPNYDLLGYTPAAKELIEFERRIFSGEKIENIQGNLSLLNKLPQKEAQSYILLLIRFHDKYFSLKLLLAQETLEEEVKKKLIPLMDELCKLREKIIHPLPSIRVFFHRKMYCLSGKPPEQPPLPTTKKSLPAELLTTPEGPKFR